MLAGSHCSALIAFFASASISRVGSTLKLYRRVGVIGVHPFYGPSGRLLSGSGSRVTGLISMAAYLAFWAAALVVAKRELDARWPKGQRAGARDDPAMAVLRERFARGELDESQFRAMSRILDEGPDVAS